MDNEKETLRKQSMQATTKLSLFLTLLLLCFELPFAF